MNDPLIGTFFGDYEILGRIGQGGMGVVYQARQISLDRRVAIKILPAELCEDQDFVARFLREARAAAHMNHPNIIPVIDAGRFQDFYFMVMEYVDGMNLGQMVRLHGPLGEVETLRYLYQAALGLGYAHRNGVIHRDVKPENLIISSDGTLKIGDLGLAKWQPQGAAASLTITTGDVIMGTPNYVSPEQIRSSRSIDPRTDIYSLGLTLFYVLVGEPPFKGDTSGEILAQHLTEPLPEMRTRQAAVNPRTEHLFQVMAEKDRAKRIQSMDEVANAIASILEQEFTLRVADTVHPHLRRPSAPKPDQPRPGRRKRLLRIAVRGVMATAAMLLLALALVGVYEKRFPPAPPPPAVPAPTSARPSSPARETAPPPPAPAEETRTPAGEPSKPSPPENVRTEKTSPATPPSTPAETTPPPKSRSLRLSADREWDIVSRPEAWDRSLVAPSGKFYLVAARDESLEVKALFRIGAFGRDSEGLQKLLREIPKCTRAVLEITPHGSSSSDLEVQIHRIIQPWGLKPAVGLGLGDYCREMKTETDWESASRSAQTPWWPKDAEGHETFYDGRALADVENPVRTAFRNLTSQAPLRLDVLPELQRMSADYRQDGRLPLHAGWMIRVSRGTGGVRFFSYRSDPDRGPRLMLTFDDPSATGAGSSR